MTGKRNRPSETEAAAPRSAKPDAEYSAELLDLSALLDVLSSAPDEFVSLGYDGNGAFHTAVVKPADAPGCVAKLPEADTYFGVNPVVGPVRNNSGRGKADDVTRLAALYCDLDVKPGACGNLDTAHAIIDELSAMLGTHPSAITHSGNGLHAYWPVSDGSPASCNLKALLKRWARLVRAVAEAHGASVDSVFDLARMLRVPGTLNCKTADRLPVTTYADNGGPLTIAEIDERLTEFGIPEEDDDCRDDGQISDSADWAFADETCSYVAELIAGLADDGPLVGNGRHQWVLKQAVRLACAWNLGCLSETDWRRAQTELDKRLRVLRAATRQSVPKYEVSNAFVFGVDKAETKTDDQARAELGDHEHYNPDAGPPDASQSAATEFDIRERNIEIALDKLRTQREAKRRLDAEERPVIEYPPVKSLAKLLDEPDTPTRYRIESLAPEGARVMLSAQYKAGKTTIVGNLLRSLVDGDDFLGAFAVKTVARHVGLIDTEMSENTLRHWLREQNIANTSAVADVIALRGRVSTFNLLDEHCHAEWVERLRDLDCDYLILDCLRPVLDSLGLDENRDAGKFLVAFDALIAEASIGEAAIVQHMGHANERARGDSRLQDWPDAIWRLVRETDEPHSDRFFSAYGRDVDVHEGRLSFDPTTRRLTYAGGSRIDAKAEAAKLAVIELLAAERESLSKRDIESALAGEHPQKAIRDGIAAAVKDGLVAVSEGPRRAKLHRIAYPCSGCGKPVASRRERHESCA